MDQKKLFKAFFGIDPSSVQKRIVVSPVVYPSQLGKVKYHRTMLGYVVANLDNMTFIKTPMLQSAVADAVVLLKKTTGREIVFVGAMGGLAKGLKIGDVYWTRRARDVYSVRSFHEETRKKMLALRKSGVVGIDFESRAFFSAAKKAGLPAKAGYVVTDLPLVRPFYLGTTAAEKDRISSSLRALVAKIDEDPAH